MHSGDEPILGVGLDSLLATCAGKPPVNTKSPTTHFIFSGHYHASILAGYGIVNNGEQIPSIAVDFEDAERAVRGDFVVNPYVFVDLAARKIGVRGISSKGELAQELCTVIEHGSARTRVVVNPGSLNRIPNPVSSGYAQRSGKLCFAYTGAEKVAPVNNGTSNANASIMLHSDRPAELVSAFWRHLSPRGLHMVVAQLSVNGEGYHVAQLNVAPGSERAEITVRGADVRPYTQGCTRPTMFR